MSRILDRVLILAALLFVAMLWQESDKGKRDDPLNLAGFEERQNRFAREIQIEERLSKR